jgi:hypothetical protein
VAEEEPVRATVASEADKFRAMLEGDSRSATLVRLFDYLLEHSASPRAPKEIEIALSVFGKNTEFDPSQDSMVRVQMHRLRHRLDGFYAGQSGPRLDIPKGEYRLILSDAPAKQGGDAPRVRARIWSPARVMALLALVNILFWASLAIFPYGQKEPIALTQSSLWRSIATGKRPPLIVAGDSYMFAQSDNGRDVSRLIMRPAILSEADLDEYLTDRPEEFHKTHDLDVHYMSANTAVSLWPMLSLASEVHAGKGLPGLTPASRLSRQALNANNIVYIGRLDELAALRPLVFHASGFELSDEDGALWDRQTGKRFAALPEAFEEAENRKQNGRPGYVHDYGYIACFPGAPGKQIAIIAGVQDLALPQMIKLVSDKAQLDVLARHTKGAPAFEALYEVRSLGGLKFETSFLMARPLKTKI